MADTAPQRTDAALTLGAGLLLGLGLCVLIGWYLGAKVLVQPVDTLPAMQPLSARGLALLGGALLVCVQRRPGASLAMSLTATLLGAALLLLYLRHGNSPPPALVPWQVRPNAAATLILGGAAMILQGLARRRRATGAPTALCAVLIVCIAGAAAVTELAGLGAGPPFTDWTRMAPHAMAAYFLLGALLLLKAGHKPEPSPSQRQQPAPWRPWAAALGVTLLAALLAVAMEFTERRQAERVLGAQISLLSVELQAQLQSQFQELNAMARRMTLDGGRTDMSWQADARQLTADGRYRQIVWLSPQLEPLVWEPLHAGRPPLPAGDPAQRQAAEKAIRTSTFTRSRVVPVAKGTPGFHIFIPVFQGAQLLGLLSATVDLPAALAKPLEQQTLRGYAVSLRAANETLYRSRRGVSPPPDPGLIARRELPELGWELRIWPLPESAALLRTALPETLFALGLLLALLLGLAMRARDLQLVSSLQVQALNADLEERVKQRTRALSREVVKRKRIAEQMAHMAKHDRLTDLPNRALFQEHLDHALQRVRREQHGLAVMFLDLDHFKEINDRHGHHVGDELLKAFASRIQSQLREMDILARQSGDEFIVLADEIHDADDARGIAEKIVSALEEPLAVDDHRFPVASSIGIATYPDAGVDAENLIRNADAAMYQAKAAGRGRYAVYSASLEERTQERLRTKSALQNALRRDEFELLYQPRVRLADASLVGAEALLRWHHPEQGLIGPERFLAVAEEDDLICRLGGEVLRLLGRDLRHWSRRSLKLPRVSVNGAPRQLHGRQLVEQFAQLLRALPRFAGLLELEFDERVFREDRPAYRETLWALQELGVAIVIDDFGSGSAHFSYFRHFPIHAIKLDRSLTARITVDQNDARIAETVLDLARNFHLNAVAEGVETAAQRAFLQRAGCDEAQGWLFGHPVSATAFFRLWREQAA